MRGPLTRLLLRRVAAGVGVLWAVSVILFLATYALPGDPATRILGNRATPETLEKLREKMGLNRSLPERYVGWFADVFSGNARSATTDTPILPTLRERGANSLILAGAASLLVVAIALTLGVASGLRAGEPADSALTVGALVGVSVPDFVVAGAMIAVFALALEWLPPVSFLTAGATPLDRPEILILPAVSLSLPAGAWASRYVRAAVVDARTAPNVEAARLAGLSPTRVLLRHLLPGALGSISQAMAAATAFLVGGAVVVEQVFAYPGMGSLLASAVKVKDVSIVMATGLVMAAVVIAAFTVADLVGLLTNPRLRRES